MAPPKTFAVTGQVISDTGEAIAEATVRLIGTIETLGAVSEAAAANQTVITWTREIAGFSGHRWSSWQKFVSQNVSGITWQEYKSLVSVYNPSLAQNNNRFEADKIYYLPENVQTNLSVVWDRPLTGFSGNRWDCWVQNVEGKVVGISWDEFKDESLVHNPQLIDDGYVFKADKSYVLPRNTIAVDYEIYTVTNTGGNFKFDVVPAGNYRLEIRADTFQPLNQNISVSGNINFAPFVLEPIVAPPSEFAGVTGGQFVLKGEPFKFVGVNTRGIVHYGDPNTLQHAHKPQQQEQLQAAKDMGVRVIRVFLPSKVVSKEEAATRFKDLLAIIKQDFPDIYVLPALSNLYNDVPFYVAGDEAFYGKTTPSAGMDTLQANWFSEGYKQNYLPFVEYIVKEFKDEPQIFAWEIGNELKVDNDPDLLIEFMHTMADKIRSWDKNHLITTGMISTRHAYMGGRPDLQKKLYEHPNIDFITNHAYQGENLEDDSALAKQLNKPFIIEEAGFDAPHGLDRSEDVKQDMEKWYNRGASGYMQWGYMATGQDNGDGDSNSGMDLVLHSDWSTLFEAYRLRALALKPA